MSRWMKAASLLVACFTIQDAPPLKDWESFIWRLIALGIAFAFAYAAVEKENGK